MDVVRVGQRVRKKGEGASPVGGAPQMDSGLRRLLQYYTGDRPGGLLLDGESNDIRYRNFTVFELDRVWNLDRKLVMPIFL